MLLRKPEPASERPQNHWAWAAPGRWIWPLPAIATWLASWLTFVLLRAVLAVPIGFAAATALAVLLACLLSATAALLARRRSGWRRGWIGLGFPASLVVLSLTQNGAVGASGALIPAWVWLAPAAICLALYPPRAWRDAPVFPTPRGALKGLAFVAPLPFGDSDSCPTVLDAGCGLGHGLRALHAAYPDARILGLEWSWPLAAWSALRCPWARVRRGDIWQSNSWHSHALVYLFQRPESMERAWTKACAEMSPGSWLVSLEFPVSHDLVLPTAELDAKGGRKVWIYRIPANLPN